MGLDLLAIGVSARGFQTETSFIECEDVLEEALLIGERCFHPKRTLHL